MSRSPLTETVNLVAGAGFDPAQLTAALPGAVIPAPLTPQATVPRPSATNSAAVARYGRRPIEFAAMGRIRGPILSILLALSALLVLAPAALGADGVGLWGRTDDKVVTYSAFAVMAFFAILVTVLSILQIRLENRRERAREDLERLRRL